jgi:hypothetical protein
MNMPYIINVAIIVAGCLAFYMILLRKETFYKLNRFMLIGCLFISFALPLLPVPQQFSFRKNQTERSSSQFVPAVSSIPKDEQDTKQVNSIPANSTIEPSSPANDFSFQQIWNWTIWIYWFGVMAFGFNFLLQVTILVWKSRRHPVIIDGRFRIIEVTGDKAPCSFGNYIFINPEKYEWETYNQILQHEKVHIRQKHTLDILLAELMIVFQWFNPFAWIYRREMENNLEYLTDEQLTGKEKVEKTSYQLSLLKVSAPHFPLSVTTNYNQSILKKRIAMMNTKRSNLHTAWKYFFLLPVLALFACLLNEPVLSQDHSTSKYTPRKSNGIETEGSWFATLKEGKVSIQFKSDDDENNSYNTNTYKLSEFTGLPLNGNGSFKLTRDAGTIEFTGKFEGNTGMGHYKFIADKNYAAAMNAELKESLDEREQLVYFFVDVKKDYPKMLKEEGYHSFTKDDLIPLAAMHIDKAYIRSIKDAGFKNVSLDGLIPLKALNIDKAYIDEIRSAGYPDITVDKLVSFKSQDIDKDYIVKMKKGIADKDKDHNKGKQDDDGDDIITFKALNITEDFANSFKTVGLDKLSSDELVTLKSLGITPDFVKSYQNAGMTDLSVDDLSALKALNITPDFKKSWEAQGFKNLGMDALTSLKALNITPEFIKGFENLGYKNITIDEATSLKATGVTPEYIKEMKAKGFDYDKLHKYITLKSID